MDEYQSFHVEAHRASGSVDFFEQQISKSQEAAVTARRQLQEALNESGWLSASSAEKTLQERIVKLELSLDEAESNLADAQSSVQMLGTQLEKIDEWIPMEITKGIANSAKDGMRTALYGEQMKKGEELARVTPEHPRYHRLKDNLDQSSEIVAEEGTDRQLTREAINPVRQQLESEYQSAIAKTAGLKSRQQSLQSSLEEAENDLQRLNEDAIVLSKLSWDADIAEKNYLEHARILEQARIVQELDNEKLSDVSVIQNASLNLKKAGPPRLLLLAIGSLLGLSLGVLQALLRESPIASFPEPQSPSDGYTPRANSSVSPSTSDDQQESDYLPATSGSASEPPLPR
jgi:uncharacterized protein involved in exopolysaccharide biosynthesis